MQFNSPVSRKISIDKSESITSDMGKGVSYQSSLEEYANTAQK